MRVTPYRKEDFEKLMEINDACYFGAYRPSREIVAEYLGVSDVYIARETVFGFEGVIGFAIVQNCDQPYIWNIAVDPQFQSRGVGGNLLREIVRAYTLSKQKRITLHVNACNPAQKLYYDYGFRVKKVAEQFFAPDDGLLMERVLP